jgi:hypothetical protein
MENSPEEYHNHKNPSSPTSDPNSLQEKRDCTRLIRSAGRSKYQFALVRESRILPNQNLATTKTLDSTPGLIAKYALSDEQALLAKIRYNRLLDTFTGVTCYSLQNHLRTTATGIGQVEIDEIYVGVDRYGAHYIFPVQAKGGRDQISIVQIEQDLMVCAERFSGLICRSIAAQFIDAGQIAMFEFGMQDGCVVVHSERHYKMVASDDLSPEELAAYRQRAISDGGLSSSGN